MFLQKIPFLLLFVLTFGVFACNSGAETPKRGSATLEAVADRHVNELIDAGQLAGAAVRVVAKDEVLFEKAYGHADLEWMVPMEADAQFEIGSITKQFTAAAILKLVEEDKLSLTDDMTQYFPDFDTRGYNINIRQLLDHTSGIQGYTESPVFGELVFKKMPRDTLVDLMEAEGFQFAPGTAQIYNNTAFFMLGLIIEQLSGTTYENYLDSVFFRPLGMENTYYCSESRITPGKAHGYDMGPEGMVHKGYLDHTWPYAAGSLCSTVADLTKWSLALHRDKKVLSDETYLAMITPIPLNDGTPQDYGLGIMAWEVDGVKVIEHGGGINGFLSDMKYLPEEDIVVVTLMNTAAGPGPGALTRKLLLELADFSPFKPIDLDVEPESFVGKYSGVARGGEVTINVETAGDLLLVSSGNPAVDTFYYAGNRKWVDPVTGGGDNFLEFSPASSGSKKVLWGSGASRNFFYED